MELVEPEAERVDIALPTKRGVEFKLGRALTIRMQQAPARAR